MDSPREQSLSFSVPGQPTGTITVFLCPWTAHGNNHCLSLSLDSPRVTATTIVSFSDLGCPTGKGNNHCSCLRHCVFLKGYGNSHRIFLHPLCLSTAIVSFYSHRVFIQPLCLSTAIVSFYSYSIFLQPLWLSTATVSFYSHCIFLQPLCLSTAIVSF